MPKARTSPNLIERIVADACLQIGRVNAGVAWAGRRLGRLGARAVAPFPWSCRLAFPCAAMATLTVYLGFFGQDWLLRSADFDVKQQRSIESLGYLASFRGLGLVARYVGFLLCVASLAAFARHRLAWRFLKIAGAGFSVVWLYLLVFLIRVPSALYMADHKTFDKTQRNDLWVSGVWLWVPAALLAGAFLLLLALRSVARFYGARDTQKARLGDQVAANLKSHGGDPRWRTSSYWSVALHLFVLFLLPLLLRDWGMQKAYGVPKGSGNPVVQMVKIKKIERKKQPRKKKLVLNMDSPIVFYRPDIDESQILKQVEQETQDQYVATSFGSGKTGKLGKGGGSSGGWPSGMENARIRFIRLEYQGGDWDQDMGVGADYNMLIEFHKITSFKIADATESITIPQLRRFPKHRGPPFVFLTGKGNIAASRKDVETLRWYCTQEGGLIFADNGGGSFNQSFRALMRRAFPELEWVDISNDDILFQQPFVFPNGAPPLWHHSGDRALGLKHNGRWVVFYHQGDLNDAWKTGHSGATENQAMQAYRLGTNIINYAFNQYMSIHYGD